VSIEQASHLHLTAQSDDTQSPSPAGRSGASAYGSDPRPTGAVTARGASASTAQHLHLVPRETNGIPLEQIPWFEDLKEVAKLYRWLEFLGEAPIDIPRFIEEAYAYQQDYEDMLMWTGRAS
jgi:hypothetical protein